MIIEFSLSNEETITVLVRFIRYDRKRGKCNISIFFFFFAVLLWLDIYLGAFVHVCASEPAPSQTSIS